jgi:hypothetical protein
MIDRCFCFETSMGEPGIVVHAFYQRQLDLFEFQDSQGYIARLCLNPPTSSPKKGAGGGGSPNCLGNFAYALVKLCKNFSDTIPWHRCYMYNWKRKAAEGQNEVNYLCHWVFNFGGLPFMKNTALMTIR